MTTTSENDPMRGRAINFATMGILDHLDAALEAIEEMTADGPLSEETLNAIDAAFSRLRDAHTGGRVAS